MRALLDGAEIVVMVHADNQYDPALVERMVKPIEAGLADVVIGSRLLEDEAIVGGMPRWKWIGNRALTAVENLVFRRGFSEYHTGYRAFSADFLRRVAFLRNSDDFVFDQEIFAQIVASGSHVVELPIPTRYFLEASSVSFRASVRYGLKTLWVLARFRLHTGAAAAGTSSAARRAAAGCRAAPGRRRPPVTVARQVARNTAAQALGKAAVLAAGAASIAVTTRYLGAAGYGSFALALALRADARRARRRRARHASWCARSAASRARTAELVGNALALRLLLGVGVVALGGPAARSPSRTRLTCAWRS